MKAISNILHCPECGNEHSLEIHFGGSIKTSVFQRESSGTNGVMIDVYCNDCKDIFSFKLYQSNGPSPWDKKESLRTPIFLEWNMVEK